MAKGNLSQQRLTDKLTFLSVWPRSRWACEGSSGGKEPCAQGISPCSPFGLSTSEQWLQNIHSGTESSVRASGSCNDSTACLNSVWDTHDPNPCDNQTSSRPLFLSLGKIFRRGLASRQKFLSSKVSPRKASWRAMVFMFSSQLAEAS